MSDQTPTDRATCSACKFDWKSGPEKLQQSYLEEFEEMVKRALKHRRPRSSTIGEAAVARSRQVYIELIVEALLVL